MAIKIKHSKNKGLLILNDQYLYIDDTMDIHAKFTGDVESTIEEIIKRGRAATKTEAIRLAVLDYRHHHLDEKSSRVRDKESRNSLTEDESIREFSSYANRDIWEDEKEDAVWIKYLKEEKNK